MKKTIFIALLAIFLLSATTAFASNKSANSNATEVRLTTEEMENYKSRVEEIRDMDKSEMSSLEKMELKSELKDIKATIKSQGPYIYIGGSTLLLIIILLIILL